jgi:hypothetical protein
VSEHDEESGSRMRMDPEWAAIVQATYPAKVRNVWLLGLLACAAILVWRYDDTARILGLASDEAGSVALWVAFLYLTNYVIYWLLGHYVTTIMFSVITGRVYVKNHVSFRVAGGFYLPFVTNTVTQLALFAYYAWTVDRSPDPIESWRSFWEYVAVVAVVQLAFTLVTSILAFGWFARQHGRPRIRPS